MKRFISTKFIHTLREASQKGIDADVEVLENRYEEFVRLLFSQCTILSDRAACYNTLVYTHAELAGLTVVSGKKCSLS
ncbi:MAG: hypothetical protein LBV71_00370 [Prevotella sp.]|jgi:hypothetical protein|nr:hypothetical protein [Prevotella sp.]